MPMYDNSDAFTHAAHGHNAEKAYAEYRKVQVRIERIEKLASDMYKSNDRQAQRWLVASEDDEAWRYRTLCGLRAAYQQVIDTETAMASLYPTRPYEPDL